MQHKAVIFQELNMMEDEELFKTEICFNGEWNPIWCISARKEVNGTPVAESQSLQIRIKE